jgi:Icc-related predicted phosphoesterase
MRESKLAIVTHHAPSSQSLPAQFLNDPLSPAYASNLEPFIEKCGAACWIHGHIHQRADFTIGNTRVLANPRGYPTELRHGFDSALVIEI